MTNVSKEQVIQRQVKAISQIRRKLMSPLPMHLLGMADAKAIQDMYSKLVLQPEFVDFHPLESTQWNSLPADNSHGQGDEQDDTKEDIRKRVVKAELNKTAGHRPTRPALTLHKTDHHINKKADKEPPSRVHSQLNGEKLKPVDKLRASKGNKADHQGHPLRGNQPPVHQGAKTSDRFKQNQSSGDQALTIPTVSNPPTGNSTQGTFQVLRALLTSIDTANRTLEAPVSNAEKEKEKQWNKASRAVAGPETHKLKAANQNNHSLHQRRHQQGYPFGKTTESSFASNQQPPEYAESGSEQHFRFSDLLQGLVETLWQQPLASESNSSGSSAGDNLQAISRQQSVTQQNNNTSSAASKVSATTGRSSGIHIPELDMEASPAMTPSDSPTPLNQAEDLAEQINRVLREQAWLRGVNLP
ncbi:hypothetical protein [Hahella ganghwensis]|uniref:hypothetical protein n=1 Tax=Hahella ganghwensis TaxID=286420 RepID=UPI00035CE4AD|nr:hypothetical protein [Hahella ganghwensis]